MHLFYILCIGIRQMLWGRRIAGFVPYWITG